MRAPVLAESVVIDAPPAHVFRVLGDSGNARLWSVFVHHISALNPEEVKDGEPGSLRRCFVWENETGARWDEEILDVVPNTRRRLSIFDQAGFLFKSDRLVTEQRYEETPDGRTVLTFTLSFAEERASPVEAIQFALAGIPARSVFRRNLANIKALAEKGESYQRVFPFVGGMPGLVEGSS